MLLSFGARQGADRGALEREVIEASLVPGLDRHVLLSALEAMRGEALLYLHHVAGRYRFEPRPNLNRLIQQEQERVGRDDVRRARARASRDCARRDGSRAPARRPLAVRARRGARRGRCVPRRLPAAGVEPGGVTARATGCSTSSGGHARQPQRAVLWSSPTAARFDAARAAARRALAVEALLCRAASSSSPPSNVRTCSERHSGHRGRAADRARARLRTRPGADRTRGRRLAALLLPRAGDDPRRRPRSARTRPRSARHPRRRQAVSREGRGARRARS